MFRHRKILIVYCTTVLTICSLYAAQPIQPVFQREFDLTGLQAILFTTLMMMPLGIAPLFYGFLLESFSAKVLVRSAIISLGVLELLFSMTDSYSSLLAIRGLQGLMIPAILTSLMSYISFTSERENVQHAIAVYIASTIVGGFLGRMLSGIFTELFGWRFFFFLLGILLIITYFLLSCLEKEVKLSYSRPKLSQIVILLKDRRFLWLYLAIFSAFFVFAALMNFLPFELSRLHPTFGEAGIGLLYLGYAMGVAVCLNTRRLIGYFGSEANAIMVGVAIVFLGTCFFFARQYSVMFVGMFVFCTGLFMAHSLLSGFANKLAEENKAIANGVYISFYYAGGTFGSFLPGVVYEHYGWSAFLLFLLGMLLLSLAFLRMLKAAL